MAEDVDQGQSGVDGRIARDAGTIARPRGSVNYTAAPLEYKLSGSKGKYILKKSVEGLLPASILHRSKKGFGVPIAQSLKGRLNPMIRDLLRTRPSKGSRPFRARIRPKTDG